MVISQSMCIRSCHLLQQSLTRKKTYRLIDVKDGCVQPTKTISEDGERHVAVDFEESQSSSRSKHKPEPRRTAVVLKDHPPTSPTTITTSTGNQSALSWKSRGRNKPQRQPGQRKSVQFASTPPKVIRLGIEDETTSTTSCSSSPSWKSSRSAELWWSDEELDEIEENCENVASSCKPYYEEPLRSAYKCWTKKHKKGGDSGGGAAGGGGDGKDQKMSPTSKDDDNKVLLDFCMRAASICSEARGLECTICSLAEDYKRKHRDAVLATQQEIRQLHSCRSSSFFDEEDFELICRRSRKYSRPGRKVATSLAQFDWHQAQNSAAAFRKSSTTLRSTRI